MTAPATIREYDISARSTPVFGRVMVSARDHHFIVDGPVQNGCPGEEVTPPELFLSAVAACGVELIHVLARDLDVPLRSVQATIEAEQDPAKRVRQDLSTFTAVRLWML